MFKEILNKIVQQCPGCVGAVVMGFDGIGIEQVAVEHAQLDLNLVGIEFSHVITEIRSAGEILRVGELHELSIKSEHFYFIIRPVTADYFVALVMKSEGNVGKGRYLLLRELLPLKQALA